MAQTDVKNMDFFEKTGYVFSLIKPSWEAFVYNWPTFVLLWLLPIVVIVLSTLIFLPVLVLDLASESFYSSLFVGLALFILIITVVLLTWPAVIITQIASIKSQKLSLKEALVKSKKVLANFVLAGLLMLIITISPLLISLPLVLLVVGLFIFPLAIVWMIIAPFFLTLTPYLVVHKDFKPLEALKESFRLVKKYWQWPLAVATVMLAVNLGASLVSWIPLIGFVVNIGLSIAYFCMPAFVYINHVIEPSPATVETVSKKSQSPKKIKKSSK